MRIVRAPFHITDRDIAALTGEEPKLSRIPPAHWRCVIRQLTDEVCPKPPEGWVEVEPKVWLTCARWLSQEIADEKGLEAVATCNRMAGFRRWAYLRAEKFAGEGP